MRCVSDSPLVNGYPDQSTRTWTRREKRDVVAIVIFVVVALIGVSVYRVSHHHRDRFIEVYDKHRPVNP